MTGSQPATPILVQSCYPGVQNRELGATRRGQPVSASTCHSQCHAYTPTHAHPPAQHSHPPISQHTHQHPPVPLPLLLHLLETRHPVCFTHARCHGAALAAVLQPLTVLGLVRYTPEASGAAAATATRDCNAAAVNACSTRAAGTSAAGVSNS